VAISGRNSQLLLQNVTIAGGNGNGVEALGGAVVEVNSCIVAFQRRGVQVDHLSEVQVRYSDVAENSLGNFVDCSPGEGTFSTDPLFANARSGDFSLIADSPCIDAGDPASSRDPDGTVADVGAFWLDRGLGNDDDDDGNPPLNSPPASKGGKSLSASPNPFNSTTVIRFEASPINREATVKIFDLAGREVFSQGKMTPPTPPAIAGGDKARASAIAGGEMTLTWDASAFPAGIYVVRVGNGIQAKSMKIVKVN